MARIQRKKQIRNRYATLIILGVLLVLIFASTKANNTRTYAVASETTNGKHYEYYTDVETKITSVDVDNKTVHITYNGRDYTYKAKGNIKTEGKIIVTFNEAMEIVSVK